MNLKEGRENNMPWGISHTQEAWTNVERRLTLKKWIIPMRQCLVNTAKMEMDGAALKCHINKCKLMCHRDLVEATLMRMREHMTCSRGGHYFFLDSAGSYQVSCDDLTDREERHVADWSFWE